MRPIELDLIPDRRWVAIWLACLLTCIAIVGGAAWPLWVMHRTLSEGQRLKAELRQQILNMHQLSDMPANPKYASAAQAARFLQVDLNPLFSTVENIQLRDARLQTMSIDVQSGAIRLEYWLASVAASIELTGQLNGGYETMPWRLETLSASGGDGRGEIRGFQGVWNASLQNLR